MNILFVLFFNDIRCNTACNIRFKTNVNKKENDFTCFGCKNTHIFVKFKFSSEFTLTSREKKILL